MHTKIINTITPANGNIQDGILSSSIGASYSRDSSSVVPSEY